MDAIIDVDGTLADASHRLHYILEQNPKDWDAFLSDGQVDQDTPIEEVWRVVAAFWKAGNRCIFITGRPERSRIMTRAWLVRHAARFGILDEVIFSRLYMRADGDRRQDTVVKHDLLEVARLDGFDPKLCFEDRAGVAAMWREAGLRCLQVAAGY